MSKGEKGGKERRRYPRLQALYLLSYINKEGGVQKTGVIPGYKPFIFYLISTRKAESKKQVFPWPAPLISALWVWGWKSMRP
jgi:hypothetical protein